MSNAFHPRTPVPAVKKPPRAPWWPREWPARIFLGFAFVVCVPFLVEYTFRPLRSEHFLRLAANEEAYGPYAVLVGIGFAAGFGWLVWKAPIFAHNEGRFDATSGRVGFAFFLIAAPLMGFWVGWMILTLWVPLLQHQFAAKRDVAVPFEVTGFVSEKFCWGVRVVHPSFYDDKLCGVDLSGPSAERIGSTLLVFGRQSPYGLTIDQYRVEPR